MRRILLLAAALCAAGPAAAQTYAVTGGRVLTAGPAGDLADGTVLIRDGMIIAVGKDVAVPQDATVIDARGRIVTPGFISPASSVGAADISLEYSDTTPGGPLSAANDMRYAFNPFNGIVARAMVDGTTAAIILPNNGAASLKEGKLFAGKGVAVDLAGTMDFVIKADVSASLDMNDTQPLGGRAAAFPLLIKLLRDAKAQGAGKGGPGKPELDALQGVVRGEEPLIVEVERAVDIHNLIAIAKAENIRIVLLGAAEGWMVADEIAAASVPVIIAGDKNVPGTFTQLNATYQNARRLSDAGVTIALLPEEGPNPPSTGYSNRFVAGRTIAYGLGYGDALRAVTINPARIFGIEQSTGSLEVGKRGDLVVWSDDPFEVSSFAEQVFIKGRPMSLVSRQTLLRDKYLPQVGGRGRP